MTEEFLLPEPDPDKWIALERAPGVRINTLWEDPATGASFTIIEVEEGAGVPSRHVHASNQFMYCLEGEYEYLEPAPGLVLRPGAMYINPKGHPHGPTRANTFTRLLEMYDGAHYFEKPDFNPHAFIAPEGGAGADDE
jgi:2,4'-dihydroxyacetophenone dioxygenase